jgi:hypothetical protein
MQIYSRPRAGQQGHPSEPHQSKRRVSASLGLVPVPGDPQREVPGAVDAGQEQERDRAADGSGRDRFLGNQSGRADDQVAVPGTGATESRVQSSQSSETKSTLRCLDTAKQILPLKR